MDNCRPILNAYINASEEVHARFKVDLQRAADISDRERDLRRVVANYIKDDDYLSAGVVAVHVMMLVDDLRFELAPFEFQIYRKTHPAN